jgi:hypothetical protein
MGKVVEDSVELGIFPAATDALGERGAHLALCVEEPDHTPSPPAQAAASSFKTVSECYSYADVVEPVLAWCREIPVTSGAANQASMWSVASLCRVRLTQGEHREELSR